MTSTPPSAGARFSPLDIGIVGAGVAAFVFSFIDYYTASVSGVTRTTGAWHGFFGWFAAVVALLAAVVVVASALSKRRPAPPYLVVLVLLVIATVSAVAALFTSGFDMSYAQAVGVAADTGHGYGYWVSLVVIIAGTVLSFVRVQQTGTRVPAFGGNRPSLVRTKRER